MCEVIRVWQLPPATDQQVERMMATVTAVINCERARIVEALCSCVPEYQPVEGQPRAMRIVADAA